MRIHLHPYHAADAVLPRGDEIANQTVRGDFDDLAFGDAAQVELPGTCIPGQTLGDKVALGESNRAAAYRRTRLARGLDQRLELGHCGHRWEHSR
jgi:hypothetical protein